MKNFINFIVSMFFVIFGIILYVSAGKNDKDGADFNKNAEPVQAYVNKVDVVVSRHKSGSGKGTTTSRDYTAYVTYEVNGMEYSNVEIRKDADELTEGTTTLMYYHKDRPSYIRVNKYDSSEGTFMRVIGIVLAIAAVFIFLFNSGIIRKIKNRMA